MGRHEGASSQGCSLEDIKVIIGAIYFFVIIFANTLGAISGIGGGIIIRPIFDAIGYHNVAAVSFYSGVSVLVMAIVTTGRKIKDGTSIRRELAILTSFGAVFGGVIGTLLFESLLFRLPKEEMVLATQISIAIFVLSLSLFYTLKKFKSLNMESKGMFFLVGTFIGCVAAFLGIGGGPLNVVAFMLFFGLPIKSAVVYSIVNIIFSQLARLITIGITTGYQFFDLTILAFIVPGAILGGLLGTKVGRGLSETKVAKVYQAMLMAVIFLNGFNLLNLIRGY